MSIPPTPQSPDAQDLLRVGRHDQVHVVGAEPEVAERRLHPIRLVDRQVDPTRAAVLMAVLLVRLAHGRVVHDRQQLAQVVSEDAVVQHFVASCTAARKTFLSRSLGWAWSCP